MISVLKKIYRVLEDLGYRPVVVGTYALILQGWLPRYYENITKDVDIYVDEPMIIFDEALYEKLSSIGLRVGKSESGGIYVDAFKPIEIVYPIFDFYVPRKLLDEIVIVEEIRVLEGHAVLVSKALGSDIRGLADYIYRSNTKISEERLINLLEKISDEVEEYKLDVAKRRIKEFLYRYRRLERRHGKDSEWEVVNN